MSLSTGRVPIVIGGHTLALHLAQESPGFALVLRASVLRGAVYPDQWTVAVDPNGSDHRPATPEDFETFRVSGANHYFEKDTEK